ncbi:MULTISPECIES: hypothetical protein [Paenibacillus]|jgi:hypothetical protein|uniref:Uncharacterized protein n=2 Tax=Paenibacillus TaxID=44249 RepID=A0AAJ3IVX3_PAEPO|nr:MULTISPECIES: hypothetical protein [Paenibacillus]AIW40315.1 hypothetical protein X809_30170 [Paenibacillus polymyxa CR1]ALA42587.1 hypothetical protein ABE82_14205 [Paenibacillus peoriae]APB75673.1 hypothetical protein PPYC2_12110 [Paenibacillus polymyxa]APQ59772.1 hypothetical protein VK72_14145 [Paenibacillus polymyxa]MCP3743066.1 hypothetical protein [Paenibacillus sp. A3M_27_13]
MAFEGYREDKREHWFDWPFPLSVSILYVDADVDLDVDETETKWYLIDEQEKHLIRIRDEKQIELLHHCMYGVLLNDEKINWIIDKNGGRFTYHDGVEDYIKSQKEYLDTL